MSAVDKILDRLQGVRQTGPGRWIAACPAHADRSPSLSIREVDDRVLLHDFGGCETGDVLAALRLDLRDLFERPIAHQAPSTHSRIPARDLLEIVSAEVTLVAILAADFLAEQRITEEDWTRLAAAARRLGNARDFMQ